MDVLEKKLQVDESEYKWLQDSLYNFDNHCRTTVFSLKDKVNGLKSKVKDVNTAPIMDLLNCADSVLYNKDIECLLPILTDLSFMMHYLYTLNEYNKLQSIWLYDSMKNSREYIERKYNVNLDATESDSTVTFQFNNFIIRCNKKLATMQTEDECDEYASILVSSAATDIEPYALLPVISFATVNDIVFQVLPKVTYATNRDLYYKFYANKKWLKEQDSRRYELIGSGIVANEYIEDNTCTKIGLYDGEPVFVDTESILIKPIELLFESTITDKSMDV